MTEDPSSRHFARALALLAVVLVAGSFASLNPDFDVTFGIEAWSRFGWIAAIVAAALAAILVSPRASEAVAGAGERIVALVPPRLRLPLALAVAVALFMTFADVSLSGDAFGAVWEVLARNVSPSHALTYWLNLASVTVLGRAGVDPVTAVRAVSWLAGLAGIAFSVGLARALFDDGPRRTAATWLLVTTGNAALWFGSVEMYAPVGAAILAYLYFAVRFARGTARLESAGFAAGVAFALHGSAGLLLLSLAVLAWQTAPDGGPRTALVRIVRAMIGFAVPAALTAAALFVFSWSGNLPAPGRDLWGNFFGALGLGPLLPLSLGPADIGPRYAFLDAEHALGVLTTVFVAAPAAWALLLTRRREVQPPAEPNTDRVLTRFALAAVIPWIVFPAIWNVSYALRRDWDLFSLLGPVAAFAAVWFVVRHRANDRTLAPRVAALCLFAFVPFVLTSAGDGRAKRDFAAIVSSELAQFASEAPSVREDVEAWERRAYELDPSGFLTRFSAGWTSAAQGRHEDAIREYSTALDTEPGNLRALFNRGIEFSRAGRAEDAERDLSASLPIDREDMRATARHELARIAVARGDFETARAQLLRGLRECSWQPESIEAARELADVMRLQGQADHAAAIDRWVEMNPRK